MTISSSVFSMSILSDELSCEALDRVGMLILGSLLLMPGQVELGRESQPVNS